MNDGLHVCGFEVVGIYFARNVSFRRPMMVTFENFRSVAIFCRQDDRFAALNCYMQKVNNFL